MRCLFLIIIVILQGCGKESNYPGSSRIAEPSGRTQPASTIPRIKTAVDCFEKTPSGNYIKDYSLKGTVAAGSIFDCGRNSCMIVGRYITYREGSLSCITKRGFEEDFRLCGDTILRWISSPLGKLAVLEVSTTESNKTIYCEKNIQRLLLKP